MFKLVIWDFLGKISNQIIAFGVSVILTRLLLPAEFGIIGIALALVSFSAIFYDFGLKASIIQADAISQKQLSTIFFLNLLGGVILFLLCFSFSGLIERFYKINGLANVIIAVGLLLIINATASLPIGLLSRKLQFKKIAFVNLTGAFAGGIVAVIMAYHGWGVWSLIANTLINAVIVLIGVFFISAWKPSLIFDLKSVKPLWNFGSTVFGIEILESVFSRIDVFLIGKVFQATTLGFYTRAQSLDNMVKQFSSGSLIAVVLPYFSRIKEDKQALNAYYQQSLHLIAMASLFFTGLLYVTSIDLFTLLFTNKWSFSGELFQIIALAGFAYPVSALMVNVILALGKTKLIVRLEVLKKIVLLPVFLFGLFGSIKFFLYGLVGAYWLIVLLNSFFVSKVVNTSFKKQVNVVALYIGIAFTSVALTAFLTHFFLFHSFINMGIKGAIFLSLYILFNYLFKTTGSLMLLQKIEHLRKKRTQLKIV